MLVLKDQKQNINCSMVDVWRDVLRPPHCTTPAAVKANKNRLQKFVHFILVNPSHAVRKTVPTVAAVHDFCRFSGVPKVQPAEDTQTMTHARSMISLVVRVISRSKNNFYDVIRLKIIENRYFLKNGQGCLEKSKQNGGQLKATKCWWISSAEISNLDVDRDFSR